MDDVRGVDKITKMLQDLQRAAPQAAHNALVRATSRVQRAAIQNAPISPTQEQVNNNMVMWSAVNATTLRRKVKGKWVYRDRNRQADASTRVMPGGLEKSIETAVFGLEGYVFVAANSHAGKYAAYIHDRRHQKPGWTNLGKGSQNKLPKHPGREVGDKFIERAMKDCEKDITRIIQDEARKAIPT